MLEDKESELPTDFTLCQNGSWELTNTTKRKDAVMARNRTADLPIEGEGVAPKKIPAVEKAASKYVGIRDERMALTKKEVDARAVLINAMHEANVAIYRFDDLEVKLKAGEEKVKVRTVDEDEDVAEEDDTEN